MQGGSKRAEGGAVGLPPAAAAAGRRRLLLLPDAATAIQWRVCCRQQTRNQPCGREQGGFVRVCLRKAACLPASPVKQAMLISKWQGAEKQALASLGTEQQPMQLRQVSAALLRFSDHSSACCAAWR